MALIVYLGDIKLIDSMKDEIYLDRKFYEKLYRYFSSDCKSPMLERLANIEYEEKLMFDFFDLEILLEELKLFLQKKNFKHHQMPSFVRLVEEAVSEKTGMMIIGDM